MDKKNVQKSIWRNLFAQKRAALGDLRNFFGDHFARPYMVRGHAPILNPGCGVSAKKAVFRGCMSLFGGFLFPEKRFWRFGDCLRRNGGRLHVPFWGVSYFRKTRLADFRGSLNRSRTRRRVHRFHRNQNRSTNGDTFGGWFSAIGRCRVRFQTQYPCKERISLKIVRLFLRMTVLR